VDENGAVTIDVRRSSDRTVTRPDDNGVGPTSRHSFSFGSHYDSSNLGFAAIVAHNDEQLPPGTGYPQHPHSDLEIVTWVLEGALRHTDSSGNSVLLQPGDLLGTHAGSGIVHSELAEAGTPARFLQTWLRPDEPGGTPRFAQDRWAGSDELVEVVGPSSGVGVATLGARLYLATAGSGSLALPDAPRSHIFVMDGSVEIADRQLVGGDAARLENENGRQLVLTEQATVAVWTFT
jgi:redox-sensitive bicupin YhaK (pirin superfamily)